MLATRLTRSARMAVALLHLAVVAVLPLADAAVGHIWPTAAELSAATTPGTPADDSDRDTSTLLHGDCHLCAVVRAPAQVATPFFLTPATAPGHFPPAAAPSESAPTVAAASVARPRAPPSPEAR